jgi:hypothetical protein
VTVADIPKAAVPAVRGTPWSLGVSCDTPGCGTSFEGDFLVAENSIRSERLRVVLDHVEKQGWRVIWRRPIGDSLTYCPSCAATSSPTGTAPTGNHSAPDGAIQEDGGP